MLRRLIHVVLALVIASTMSWSAAHARATSAAEGFGIDDIIDPRETRMVLARALKLCWNREVERPHRKRGVMPV